mmetsp:Transcript_38176/g.94701  ORF Transcript_38176/g.94701 Transcript_38176/m.94701 type:complete len:200 (+) Transcript_38176:259-858(+)
MASTAKTTHHKSRICPSWAESSYCQYGARCNFAHGSHELSQQAQDLWKTKMCTNWVETGTCRTGDVCSFAHGDAELQSHWKYEPATATATEHWVNRGSQNNKVSWKMPDAWADVENRRAAALAAMQERAPLARPKHAAARAGAEFEDVDEWADATEEMTDQEYATAAAAAAAATSGAAVAATVATAAAAATAATAAAVG